jgi:hypothetical protein
MAGRCSGGTPAHSTSSTQPQFLPAVAVSGVMGPAAERTALLMSSAPNRTVRFDRAGLSQCRLSGRRRVHRCHVRRLTINRPEREFGHRNRSAPEPRIGQCRTHECGLGTRHTTGTEPRRSATTPCAQEGLRARTPCEEARLLLDLRSEEEPPHRWAVGPYPRRSRGLASSRSAVIVGDTQLPTRTRPPRTERTHRTTVDESGVAPVRWTDVPPVSWSR